MEKNRFLQEKDKLEWMTKWKPTLIQKHPQKHNRSIQLQVYNVPTDDVENINGIYREGDIRFLNKPRTIHWRTETMPQGNKRNRRSSIAKRNEKKVTMALIVYEKA